MCTLTLLASGPSSATTDRVMRLVDRQVIDFNRMVAETGSARFIFIAEIHNEARHHSAQLELIRGVHASGRPLAIGLEMFTVESQEKLDQWVSGKLSLEQFKEVYRNDWGMPWEHYQEILTYARDNRIRLYGLNLPKAISSKVAREGFAALTPTERRLLPPEITCDVSPGYM
ncbi:MAG TPA: ChaN family lipoprotein, partial [Geobacteraceae bacterium]|nr:ChaN family lipoprotein [Geobacteraceae bacterium]